MVRNKAFIIFCVILLCLLYYGTLVQGAIIYVDAGSSPGGNGQSWNTAYRFLQDALYAAMPEDEIWIAEGRYFPDRDESGLINPGDRTASFQLKSLVLIYGGFLAGGNFADRDPETYQTVLDGDIGISDEYVDNSYHVVRTVTNIFNAVIDGVIIKNGNADGSNGNDRGGGIYISSGEVIMNNCRIETSRAAIGGGLYNTNAAHTNMRNCTFVKCSALLNAGTILNTNDAELILDNCTLINTPYHETDDLVNTLDAYAELLGVTNLEEIVMAGAGPWWLNQESILVCRTVTLKGIIAGPGTVEIATRLRLEQDAILNLDQATAQGGAVLCDGLLTMTNQTTLLANTFNVSSPYGQYFLHDAASMWLQHYIAKGDALPDFDARVFDQAQINIALLDVIINPHPDTYSGELLELRGVPDDNLNIVCDDAIPNLCQLLDFTPEFDTEKWSLNKLILTPNARATLTNRFDYHNLSLEDEVIYIREVTLEPDSVLNLAGKKLYYQELHKADSAQIVNLPLMGFSLDEIRFNQEEDYLVKLDDNNQADDDIRVRQVFGQQPDPDGMLEMRPVQTPTGNLLPARFAARFAKANEDEIAITFEYQFFGPETQNLEMLVYLSENPENDTPRRQIAAIRPPAPGRPGSADSNRFATFSTNIYRNESDLIMGSYVELECRYVQEPRNVSAGLNLMTMTDPQPLAGNSGTYINNLDTQIQCYHHRYDFNASGIVGIDDYLLLVAEYGLVDPNLSLACLDVTNDYNVNIEDLLIWSEDIIAGEAGVAALPAAAMMGMTGGPAPLSDPNTPWTQRSALLLSGNPTTSETTWIGSRLYPIYIPGWDDLNSGEPPVIENHRLVANAGGEVYQIDQMRGLIRLSDDTIIVEPNSVSFDGKTVDVDFEIVSDAAFDPYDGDTLFVTPVTVSGTQGCDYRAAARLSINGAGGFTVEKLYGMNPALDPLQQNTPADCNDIVQFVYEPDVQHPHELEVDWDGRLYVLSVCGRGNNNWLLTYDIDTGTASEQRIDLETHDPNLSGPMAMVVSPVQQKLFIGDTIGLNDDPNSPRLEIHQYDISNNGGTIQLGSPSVLQVNTSSPAYCQSHSCTEGYKAALTGLVEDVTTGTLYAIGYTAPILDLESLIQSATTDFFSTPIYAVIDPDSVSPATAQIIESDYDYPLTLPLSLAWTYHKPCGQADLDDNLKIDMDDFGIISDCWLKENAELSPDCILSDINGDSIVNLTDLGLFVGFWLECDCLNGN